MHWGAGHSLCWRLLMALALGLGLSGCGFELRRAPEFAFKTIYVAVPPTSLLGVELKRHLAVSEVELITEAQRQAQAAVVLELLGEQRTKVVAGMGPTGQVREFQLRMSLRFRLRTPQGKELIPETELVQQRDQSYDEVYALAKEAEEVMLYRNMQSDLVQQILRRLAAVKSL